MKFGVCHTDTFTNTNTKLILLWVMRSRSLEFVFCRFSNQHVYNQCGTGADVPHSGYCWVGVALFPCIGVYRRLCMKSNCWIPKSWPSGGEDNVGNFRVVEVNADT
jgi:hypothetical protein